MGNKVVPQVRILSTLGIERSWKPFPIHTKQYFPILELYVYASLNLLN